MGDDSTLAHAAGSWRWQFGNAELNEATMELRVAGAVVALERKPMEVLRELLRHEGELVTKEDLFESVWAGRIVTDGVLSQAIRHIRAALGDHQRKIVRTVHGYGFRLDAPICCVGRTETPTQLNLEPGQSPPRQPEWELCERLGGNPQNELWRVVHRQTGEQRVFKFALDERSQRALKREVTLNRILRQSVPDADSIVPILDWELQTQPVHIELPWRPCGSLLQWLEAQGGVAQVELKTRINLILQAARAVAAAHDLGVIHKDIKPANLLIDDRDPQPRVQLTDFGSGTVRHLEQFLASGITISGFTRSYAEEDSYGTPAYVAPEVVVGEVATEQADVYSLGVLLYQLVSGDLKHPLATGWEADVTDAGLRTIIAAAAAGRPEARLASAAELVRQLEDWLSGRPAIRARLRVAAAILSAALILALGGILLERTVSSGTPMAAESPPESPYQAVILQPFSVSSPDADDAAIARGLHAAVLAELTRYSGLRISARPVASATDDSGTLISTDFALESARLRVAVEMQNSSQGTASAFTLEHPLGDALNLQAEFARRIAMGLRLSLQASDPSQQDRSVPRDPQLIQDYLTARAAWQVYDWNERKNALALLERVVAEAPDFALAQALLSFWSSFFVQQSIDLTPERRRVARETAEAAQRLAPDLGEAHLARGMYLYGVVGDMSAAMGALESAALQLPGDADVQLMLGQVLRRQNRWEDSLQQLQETLRLAPTNEPALFALMETYYEMHRYEEALATVEHAMRLLPEQPLFPIYRAHVLFMRDGDGAALEGILNAPDMLAGEPTCLGPLIYSTFLRWLQRIDEARTAIERCELPFFALYGGVEIPISFFRGELALLQGRQEEAHALLTLALEMLEEGKRQRPSIGKQHAVLSMAQAYLGHVAAARASAETAELLATLERDAIDFAGVRDFTALARVYIGDIERVIADLPEVLERPFGLHRIEVQRDPLWAPLRADPRFASLIEEYL